MFCKKRWRSLRDTFFGYYKLEGNKPVVRQWILYDQMSFISEFLPMNRNKVAHVDGGETEGVAATNVVEEPNPPSTMKRRRKVKHIRHGSSDDDAGGDSFKDDTQQADDKADHLQEVEVKPHDEHSVFGEFIASELRRLPAKEAHSLKRRLNRSLLDYYDEFDVRNYIICN